MRSACEKFHCSRTNCTINATVISMCSRAVSLGTILLKKKRKTSLLRLGRISISPKFDLIDICWIQALQIAWNVESGEWGLIVENI